MNKAACEKLVDAYGLAVELFAENERREDKSAVDIGELCDNLRDVLAELSSGTHYYPLYVNAPSWKPDTYKPTVTWTGEADVSRPLNATGVN